MDLKKLCADSHRISKEKGWLDGPPRPFAAIADLIHSELSEALEDYRNNKGLRELYFERSTDNKVFSEEEVALWSAADRRLVKPCGIPIELADVVIRIAQHCGTEGWDLAGAVEYKNSLTRRLGWGDFESALAWAHTFVSRAFLASEKQHLFAIAGLAASNTANEVLTELANVYLVVADLCHISGIYLEKAVELKQAYNETRSHRHGGKKI